MIVETTMVLDGNSISFLEKLNSAIGKMQNEGLTVEIQYSSTMLRAVFSALVIGRD
jgi:hypothetical protein